MPNRPATATTGGLSLVEVLIAMAILLVIVLAIVPLLGRAQADNVRGWESTAVASHLRASLEPFLELELSAEPLTVAAGSSERLTTDYWTAGRRAAIGDPGEGWCADPAARGEVVWTRQARVRQFNLADLGDPGDPHNTPFDEPLAGSAPPGSVHLKEIRVEISGRRRGGLLGAGQGHAVTLLKAF